MTRPGTNREIRRATPDDINATSNLIATAFHELDVSAWLVPDPSQRTRVLANNFRIFVEHALTHGAIDVIDDSSGNLTAAAVWFPEQDGHTAPPDDYDARLQDACGPATDRFHTLDQNFADTHPDAFPHHYLAFLATEPNEQGQGHGSALLRHHHSHLDHHDTPAFLHASCARARDLYLRHGYQCRGDAFRLPGGPPMWPMWREPTSRSKP